MRVTGYNEVISTGTSGECQDKFLGKNAPQEIFCCEKYHNMSLIACSRQYETGRV